jgi:hypothetical protein
VHAYRRPGIVWTFELITGGETEVVLPRVGISVPLAAL